MGSGSSATGLNATALGGSTRATADNATSVGQLAWATVEGGTAIGRAAYVYGAGINATAVGLNAWANGASSVALGAGSRATEANVVSVGNAPAARIRHAPDRQRQRRHRGSDAATVGQLEQATQDTRYFAASGGVDSDNAATSRASTRPRRANPQRRRRRRFRAGQRRVRAGRRGHGGGLQCRRRQSRQHRGGRGQRRRCAGCPAVHWRAGAGANSVALGQGSVADEDNTVSVRSEGNERQVTNVAAGRVALGSTDAVTGPGLRRPRQCGAGHRRRIGGHRVRHAVGARLMIQGSTYSASGMRSGPWMRRSACSTAASARWREARRHRQASRPRPRPAGGSAILQATSAPPPPATMRAALEAARRRARWSPRTRSPSAMAPSPRNPHRPRSATVPLPPPPTRSRWARVRWPTGRIPCRWAGRHERQVTMSPPAPRRPTRDVAQSSRCNPAVATAKPTPTSASCLSDSFTAYHGELERR